MSNITQLITDHLDIWTAADTEKKSGRGRASGNANSVYGIKKLRELILELAVRGKLVPQDPNDEPTSELVKRINAEKKLLVKDGKIRNGKALPKIEPTEETYAKPHNWEWIRLGDLGDWGAGATPSRANSSYYGGTTPWFKSGELTADFIDTAEETVTELALKECSLRLNQPGDVLIAMYGATIGKTAILKAVATTNQAVCACTPCTGILNTYLLVLLKALKSNFIGQGAGGAQPNISREKIIATVAALPPTEEQHRIVAKVNELMALCDQLEAQHNNAADAHEQLVSHLLSTLTQSQDAADFNANWQRIATHFDTLFTTESSIDALKQTLLQLAVMGKLVPQDPNDEPASELLKKLRKDRFDWLTKNNNADPECRTMIRKLANLEKVNSPFPIPRTWTTAHLIDCSRLLVDCHNKTAPYSSSGIPIIRTSNIRDRKFKLEDMKYVTEDTYNFWSRRCPPIAGDIMFTREAPMGEAAIIPTGVRYCLGQRSMLIRPMHDFVNNEYLLLALTEPHLLERSSESAIGSTVKHLRVGDVENLNIPLPPIAEQQRIVAKVDELMTLCEQLKFRITDACQQQRKMADVIAAQTCDQ